MNVSTLFRAVLVALSLSVFSLSSVATFAAKDEKTSVAKMAKISINSANAMMLSEVLTGVGLKKAEAIVAYRKANGKFTRLEDLTLVKGIGLATYEKNKAKLTL